MEDDSGFRWITGELRLCRTCKSEKPLTEFHKNPGSTGGRIFQCKTCYHAQTNAARRLPANKARYRAYARSGELKRRYGITEAEYAAMLHRQSGVCAICQLPAAGTGPHSTLHVDHCHETGAVRGLLCGKCNFAVGLFSNDPTMLRRAVDYLATARNEEEINATTNTKN